MARSFLEPTIGVVGGVRLGGLGGNTNLLVSPPKRSGQQRCEGRSEARFSGSKEFASVRVADRHERARLAYRERIMVILVRLFDAGNEPAEFDRV